MKLFSKSRWVITLALLSALMAMVYPQANAQGTGKLIGVSGFGTSGGTSSWGTTVYSIDATGTFTTIFTALRSDGLVGSGQAEVTLANGKFYLATYGGGTGILGTLFSINPDGSGYQKIFDYTSTLGYPGGALVESNGRLWGTSAGFGNATIYSIKTDGTNLRIHHNFTSEAGTSAEKLLVVGNYLYGVSSGGGANGEGYIFRIDNDGNNYQKLFDFPTDDGYSRAELILVNGKLWGTTSGAVTGSPVNLASDDTTFGTVFSINTDGTNYQVVHRFAKDHPADADVLSGRHVISPLLKVDNRVWGNTQFGGDHNGGVIFYIDLTDNSFHKVYSYQEIFGNQPRSGFTYHNNELWGTTLWGGDHGYGTVYRFDPVTFDHVRAHDNTLSQGAYSLAAKFIPQTATPSTPLAFANVPDAEILEDAAASEIDLTAYASGDGVTYSLVKVSDTNLFPNMTVSEAGKLAILPAANAHGTAEIIVKATDVGGNSLNDTLNVVVKPVADTPTITSSQTAYGSRTTTGLVISRNPVDGPEVTHFHITGITNGKVTILDGTTEIAEGYYLPTVLSDQISFYPSSAGSGSFQVQASTSASAAGLGGGKALAIITVAKAPLTITAQNKTIDEGDAIPAFSLQYSGFVQGDNETSITVPTASTTATSASPAGNYTITLTGGASNNYDLTKVNGTLTIRAKPTRLIGVAGSGSSNGTSGFGTTVYTIDPSGTFTTLFTDLQSNGLVGQGQNEVTLAGGKFWLATYGGGTGVVGTLFSINPDGTGYEKTFDYTGGTLGYPGGPLVEHNGRLWGTAGFFGEVKIYSIKTDGTDLQTHHVLEVVPGTSPEKLLLSGNYFYGLSSGGGANGEGYIYRIDNQGNNFQKLFDFPVNDGYSRAELIEVNGRLWGTTSGSRTGSPGNLASDDTTLGTVFSILPDGTDYQVVHRFERDNPADVTVPGGRHLVAPLLKVGNKIWGNTQYGGDHNAGVIFNIDLTDNSFQKVHSFQSGTGSQPLSGYTLFEGELWGTTFQGGDNGNGVIYRFNPQTLVYTVVRHSTLDEGRYSSYAEFVPQTVSAGTALEFANVPNVEIDEDAASSEVDVSPYATGSGVNFELVSNSNSELFPGLTMATNGKMNIQPYLNRFGNTEVTVKAKDALGNEKTDTFLITVKPKADAPVVTAQNTTYGSTTPANVQVERNLADGLEVTHLRFTSIQNGKLYQPDGTTEITEGSFLTVEEVSRGLKFQPVQAGTAGFDVEAGTGALLTGLGGKTTAQLSIEKAELTVRANDLEINKGQDIPTLTYAYQGFVNGENASAIAEPTASTVATSSSNAGAYDIVLTGGAATNYQLVLINGVLTINEAANAPIDEFEDRLVGTGSFAQGSNSTGASIFAITETLSIENWLSVNGSEGTTGQIWWSLVEANEKLWGVTYGGGANDLGILFSINKDGTGFTKVFDFDFSFGYPTSGLTLAGGYLYGATAAGFGQNTGVVYRITTSNTTPEKVHEFSNRDGWAPRGLTEVSGKLYGLTHYGGDNGQGVMFSLNTDGTGFEKLYDFADEKGKPEGELFFHQGRLWGTAKASRFDYPQTVQNTDPAGMIFSVLTDGSDFRIEHTFIKTNPGDTEYKDGRHPFGNLVAAEGVLWGMTPFGGENGHGVIYKIDPATSLYQKVHDFTSEQGSRPRGSFLVYQNKLWGMTFEGGANGLGTVFTFDPQSQAYAKIADLSNATGGKPLDGPLMVIQTKKKFNVTIPDIKVEEGAGQQTLDLAKYFESYLGSVTGTPVYAITGNTQSGIFSQTDINGTVFSFTPLTEGSGTSTMTVSLSGDQGEVANGQFLVEIVPVIDGINVSELVTATYGSIATEAIQVSRHALDGTEVSHFKVSNLNGLSLFLPDGITPVTEGSFLSFSQVQSGLKVQPQQVGDFAILFQAATAANDQSLGGDVAITRVHVNKADLFVTADNQSITYGDALPALSLTYQGFVSGESVADITAPLASTTATANSNAGDYVISVTGGAANNYELHLQNGQLTIAKAILNVTVSDDYLYQPTRIQPNLTVTITGFVNGENSAVLDELPTVSTTVNAYSPVADYVVSATGGAATNYTFNRVSGTIRVGSAAPETGDVGNPDNRRGKFVLVGTSTFNGGTLFSIDKTDYTKLWHSFTSVSSGQNPISSLTEADEKLYGVTSIGGANSAGVLYSITKEQQYTKIHDFDFAAGAQPIGTPLLANGRLWGTTSLGGANNQGVLYSIKADGTDYQVHVHFNGTNGAFPSNGLLLVSGKLWGMTTYGGTNQRGVIYTIDTDGSNYNIVHEFADKKGIPFGELVLAEGKLWGLTRESQGPQQFFVPGDAEDNGAIFSINLDGTGYTEVYEFAKEDNLDLGLKNGRHPHGSLVAYNGALWGMTTYGGDVSGSNFGTIFKLDISGASPVFTKKYNFNAPVTGSYPRGNLVVYNNQLYGLTSERGQNNLGSIFSFNPTTDEMTLRYHFNSPIGGNSVTSFLRAFVDLIPTLKQPIPDFSVNEGTDKITVNLNEYFTDQDLQEANLDFDITLSGTPGIVSHSEITGATLNLYLNANAVGETNVTIKASAAVPATVSDVFKLEVLELPDAPVVQNINAVYGTLSTESVAVTKNPLDGPGVTHFQVNDITNGTLFKADGVSQLNNGDFITLAEGQAGLRFFPTQVGQGSFSAYASTTNTNDGLGADKSTALITVAKAPLKVKANDVSSTYGQPLPAYSLSYTGFVLGDDASKITAPQASSVANITSDAHTYAIELTGGAADNYELELVNGVLSIEKAALTATADDKSMNFGESLPAFTISYNGFLNGDTPTVLTEPVASTPYTNASGTGSFGILLNGGFAENYSITRKDGTLNVAKVQLVIKADDKQIVYGQPVPELTMSIGGLEEGENPVGLVRPTLSVNAGATPGAGEYTIELVGGSSNIYDLVLQTGKLTVTQAPLTITADNKSITVGDAMPALTMTYAGFVNGDDQNSITPPAIATTALNTNTGGQYPINLSGAVASNYSLTLINGQLSINKIPLTVTADNQSFVYGSPVPQFTLSYSGFTNGDDATSITSPVASASVTSTSPVGSYAISLSGGVSDKYNFQLVNGVVSITEADLFIQVNDKTMTYGDPWTNPTSTTTGLVAGDEGLVANLPYSIVIRQKEAFTPFAGTYTINLDNNFDLDNYKVTWAPGTLIVNKATLTATANDQAITYGGAVPALTMSLTGFVSVDTEADVTAPSISTTATNSSGAGIYPITLSGGVAENYNFVLNDGALTIGKAPLTITADDKQMTYGGTVPAWTLSYAGFVNGEDVNAITQPVAAANVTQNSVVGSYPIQVTGGSANNYELTLVDGTLAIGKTQLTVTADDQSFTYGTAVPTLTRSYQGFVNGDDESSITPPDIATTALSNSNVGTYDITLSGGSATNYELVLVNGTATVGKASLSIKADDQSITYGEGLPNFTATVTGLVSGDEAILTPLTFTTSAGSTPLAGSYDITPTGVTANNYNLTMVNGTLTVSKAVLNVTADDQLITYGQSLLPLTMTYAGFVNGESEQNITAPAITTSATTGSAAGSYTISLAGGAADNYSLNLNNGTLTIGKAALTIAVNDEVMTYGDAVPAFSAVYTGLANGDAASDFTNVVSLSSTAGSSPASGTYAIEVSLGNFDNYLPSVQAGTLTVNKAALTITADDQQMGAGSAVPALTLTYSGFVNGDDANAIEAPVATVNADENSAIGVYPITLSGGVSANYNITLVNGQLTIGKAILTITADDKSFVYGSEVPALTLSYQGFTNGDDESSIVPPEAATTVVSKSDVGSYEISLTGGVSAKYDIRLVNGAMTVTKASLTISADDKSMTYGEAVPAFTSTITGLVSGDEALLAGLSYISSNGTTPDAGDYSITPTGVTADNYDMSLMVGTLSVAKADLTVSTNDLSITYGDDIPTPVLSYSGFVNGDTKNDIQEPTATTTANGSNAGSYPITLADGISNNYNLIYNPATLTIGKAAVTLKADDLQMTYGNAVPAFTASLTGLVNGDQQADFDNQISLSSTVGSQPASGSYPIEVSHTDFDNYEVTVQAGVLQVDKASLTITAEDKQMLYGGTVPDWTLKYQGFQNGDSQSDITIPAVAVFVTSQSSVGNYSISLSGASAVNYDITLVNGTCRVLPVTLIVNAVSDVITYGDALPAFNYNIRGFVNGEEASVLDALPVITHEATNQSEAGTYPLTISGASATNYSFVYLSGQLTILPARLRIIAQDLAMIYGEEVPEPAISFEGFQHGESPEVLSSIPTAHVNATRNSSAGTYPIEFRGEASANNYEVELVSGTLTIGKAPLYAKATDFEIVYGSAFPTLTVEYTGFLEGDTEFSIAAPFPITQANGRSDVGVYPIVLTGGSALNYEVIKEDGLLTIVKAEQTIEFTVEQANVRPTQTIELNAKSTSGLPLVFTVSDESLMRIENGIATPLNVGQVTVTASHPGNQNFYPAESVTRSFNIITRLAPERIQRIDLAYPNPADNSFRVKEPVDIIELFDNQGILVKRFEGDYDSYDVADLKRGIYTVYYYKNGQIGMSRLLIWR